MDIHHIRHVWQETLDAQLGAEARLFPQELAFFDDFLAAARKARRILEVGVGNGRMVEILRGRGVSAEIVGIDLYKPKRLACSATLLSDARRLPFADGAFDLVYSLGAVEHFEGTEIALHEHVRVTRPGGYVLVTTPRRSFYTLLRWIAYLLRERSKGSFQTVVGKNLRLSHVEAELLAGGLEMVRSGKSGWVAPGMANMWKRFVLPVFPSDRFGAYLYCLGRVREGSRSCVGRRHPA